jgi:hypothetical protein
MNKVQDKSIFSSIGGSDADVSCFRGCLRAKGTSGYFVKTAMLQGIKIPRDLRTKFQ